MEFHYFINSEEWNSFGGNGNTKFLFSGVKKEGSHKGEICVIFAGHGGGLKYKSLESNDDWVTL